MTWAPNLLIHWQLVVSIALVLLGVVESVRIWRRERIAWVLAFTGLLGGIALRYTVILLGTITGSNVLLPLDELRLGVSVLALVSVVGIGRALSSHRRSSLEASRVRSALQDVGAARATAGELSFFEHAAPKVTEILDADAAMILGFDRNRRQLRILAVSTGGVLRHPSCPTIEVEAELRSDRPWTWMEALRRAFPDEPGFRDRTESEVLALPLQGDDNEERGVLAVLSRTSRERSEELATSLEILARRTQDELERLERDERQRTSEQRYRVLFEESHDARYAIDLQGRVLEANPACIELFGYESLADFLEGFDLAWHFPRDIRERTQRGLIEDGVVMDLEGQLRTRDGHIRYCVISATLGRFADEDMIVRGALRDVTEQRSMANELARAQRMETVGRMAGGVAHDFNNITMVIEGAAELLSTRHTDDVEMHEDVSLIRSATRRARAFTQRLLFLGRRRSPEPETVDLRQIVQGLETILSHAAGDAVQVRLTLDEEPAWLFADPSQLEQVLLNLTVNARDAMPDGGTLEIRVENSHRPDGSSEVLLAVEDEGKGIPTEDFERVFEPFFSTKEGSVGSGLGLSTVVSLVEGLGGSVNLRSVVGEGTCFELTFPRLSGPSKDDSTEPDPRPKATEHILVVDDDVAVATVLCRLLRTMGYTISVASSGPEALSLLRQHDDIELMISDMVMPEMTGIELALAARAERPDLKVILISGYSEELMDVGNAGQQVDFLPKPLAREELAKKVRSLLDHEAPSVSF